MTDDARAQQGIPRRGQVEQTARLQERAVRGADSLSYSNGHRADVAPGEAQGRKPARAGALAGLLVGLVLGRRQRARK